MIYAALCALVMLAFGTMSGAADFSADMVQSMGNVQVKGKINISGAKARIETQMGPQKQVTIVRGEEGVVYVINPEGKFYSEMRVPKQKSAYDAEAAEKQLATMAKIEKLGSETVNGYLCDKTLFKFKDKKRGTMTTWVSKKLAYPVKTETVSANGKFGIQLNNIKMGKQDASLFTVPKGFKKQTLQRPMMPPNGNKPGK